jgi:hypothetical protein
MNSLDLIPESLSRQPQPQAQLKPSLGVAKYWVGYDPESGEIKVQGYWLDMDVETNKGHYPDLAWKVIDSQQQLGSRPWETHQVDTKSESRDLCELEPKNLVTNQERNYSEERSNAYLAAWPVHKQLEAMQDFMNRDSTKWDLMQKDFQDIRTQFPSSSDATVGDASNQASNKTQGDAK